MIYLHIDIKLFFISLKKVKQEFFFFFIIIMWSMIMRGRNGEKIIELNNKHQFKKNKQVKKGCAKVKEKVEILISFE